MLWKVSTATQSDIPRRSCSGPIKADEGVHLTLLMILPVHEEGASCLAFTVDDQALVTCDGCVVKLWDVSDASTDNQDEGNKLKMSLSSLSEQLDGWQRAIPFSFSIESSTNLFAFDESVTALVPNHEWMNFRERAETLTLLAPSQTEGERNDAIDIRQCVDHIIEEIDPSQDEAQKLLNALVSSKKDAEEGSKREDNNASDANALTPEESARLRTQFRSMENFDFERLFTPAMSLSMDCIPTKTLTRVPPNPDADGRLIRSFSKCTAVSFVLFCSFSSTFKLIAVLSGWNLLFSLVDNYRLCCGSRARLAGDCGARQVDSILVTRARSRAGGRIRCP